MKQIISISLGSAQRDHEIEYQFADDTFLIRRIGTNGNKELLKQYIAKWDGKAAAFGLGGTDLYIYAGRRKYVFRESAELARTAIYTPIVDGSGIKNTLERYIPQFLREKYGFTFKGKKALLVCAVDRFGLAESLVEEGCQTLFGDLLFGLGLPVPIKRLESLERLARYVAPVITQLPIQWFYPTGDKQQQNLPKYKPYFAEADIIAGDFHLIKRYMPQELNGKMMLTNTVTQEDEKLLTTRGLKYLVTTTPNMGGRSFGTNVLEALLTAVLKERQQAASPENYLRLIAEGGIEPRVVDLQK